MPPMVPLIPEIDFISANVIEFCFFDNYRGDQKIEE
jgi:hypothetical protein